MNPTTTHGIVYYLLSHQMRLKQELNNIIKQHNELKTKPENSLFINDIDKQFVNMVKFHLVNDITKALGVSTEEVLSVVEDLNIQEYLK
jgi:hypothetical protein